MPAWLLRLLPYLLVPLLVWTGYHWAVARGERMSDARHAATFKRLAALTAEAARKARAASETVRAEREALDAQHQEDMNRATAEADRLRADLRAGRRELQEWWACPVPEPDAGGAAPDRAEAEADRRIDSAARIAEAVDIDAAVINWLWGAWQADRQAVIAAGCAVEAVR